MKATATVTIAVLGLILLLGPEAQARPPRPEEGWCGTGAPIRDFRSGQVIAAGARETLMAQLHEAAVRQRQRSGFVPTGGASADIENIAVLEDDGTLTLPGNHPIDLQNFNFRMTPVGMLSPNGITGYDLTTAGVAGIQNPQGTDINIGDDATMEIAFTGAFTFPFFGQSYSSVFVNSDGNISFTEGDSASTGRTPSRLIYGPPRIAPMLTDLDPSSGAGSEVRYIQNLDASVHITWVSVPKFGGTGTSTFQIRIFATGVVEISYTTISWTGSSDLTGVTGYAPGGGMGPITSLDWTTGLPQTNLVSALEGWNANALRVVDDQAVAQRFYQTHGDDYDFLVVFSNFTFDLGGGAFAYHAGVFNDIAGINRGSYDSRAAYGSDYNLDSFLQMGPLSQYPPDPTQDFLGQNDTFDIFGQEAGHRWLTFVLLPSPPFPSATFLLGRQLAHWSYFANTETITSSGAEHRSSVAEGNDLIDLGGGIFDVESCKIQHYSNLDRYIMGLIPDFVVPGGDLWATTDTSPGKNASSAPSCNVPAWTGATRHNFTMANIITANGARIPAWPDAQEKWTQAHILVVLQGAFPPPQADIDKLNGFRTGWEAYFSTGTGGLGVVESRLIQGTFVAGTGSGSAVSRARKYGLAPVSP